MDEFKPMDYADEFWSETLQYMTEEEKEQIYYLETRQEVNEYLSTFYERT